MNEKYQTGFGNEFATEAVEGALPVGRNSPQKAPLGLYAEQFSGTAFTVPRVHNKRTWTYRIRPSVLHKPFKQIDSKLFRSTPFDEVVTTPNQLRWDPLPVPDESTDFVDGVTSIAGNGDLFSQTGIGIHIYRCNRDMENRFFYNADGEMLIVPEMGGLTIFTELGVLEVVAGEVCCIPRGLKFRVALNAGRGMRNAELEENPKSKIQNPKSKIVPGLYLRKLRHAVSSSGSRADRCERPGEPT